MNLRSEWFVHVSEVHKKLLRKNKECTRREAMKTASTSWPKKKAKLLRKVAKEKKESTKVD